MRHPDGKIDSFQVNVKSTAVHEREEGMNANEGGIQAELDDVRDLGSHALSEKGGIHENFLDKFADLGWRLGVGAEIHRSRSYPHKLD